MNKDRLYIIGIIGAFCIVLLYGILNKKEPKPEVKPEIKMEYSETKVKENMKLFPAPKGWVIIYGNSVCYVPDEEHCWELAKKK